MAPYSQVLLGDIIVIIKLVCIITVVMNPYLRDFLITSLQNTKCSLLHLIFRL